MSTDAPDTAAPFEKGYYDPPGRDGGSRKVTSDITPAEATAFKALESEEKLAVIAHAEQRTASIDSSTMARNLARAGTVLAGVFGASEVVGQVVEQVTGESSGGSFPWGVAMAAAAVVVFFLLAFLAYYQDTRRTARARARVDMYRAIAELPDEEGPTKDQQDDGSLPGPEANPAI